MRERPVRGCGQPQPPPGFDTVAADDELAAQLVVDHLVEMGHRHIAFVTDASGRDDETGWNATVFAVRALHEQAWARQPGNPPRLPLES